jgi:hypothetical protein
MIKKFKVNRDVTRTECGWLSETVEKDSVVYECIMTTYGCISPSGIAVTIDQDGGYPFFELPYDSLEEMATS